MTEVWDPIGQPVPPGGRPTPEVPSTPPPVPEGFGDLTLRSSRDTNAEAVPKLGRPRRRAGPQWNLKDFDDRRGVIDQCVEPRRIVGANHHEHRPLLTEVDDHDLKSRLPREADDIRIHADRTCRADALREQRHGRLWESQVPVHVEAMRISIDKAALPSIVAVGGVVSSDGSDASHAVSASGVRPMPGATPFVHASDWRWAAGLTHASIPFQRPSGGPSASSSA